MTYRWSKYRWRNLVLALTGILKLVWRPY